MSKFVFSFLWFVVAFDLIAFATANSLNDGNVKTFSATSEDSASAGISNPCGYSGNDTWLRRRKCYFSRNPTVLRRIPEEREERQMRRKPILNRRLPDLVIKRLPIADGNFHVYVLPVGQGSGQVLQCPNGDITIIDLGSREKSNNGFWSTKEIKVFLQRYYHRIKNIVITHDHFDHYSFFSRVFSSASDLKELNNIYISCTPADMNATLHNWINNIGASNKLRTFNEGHTCGSSNGKPCENITLCPGNPEIKALVLSANAANCNNSNKNIDSIVIGIKFKNFTMQLNGDFEDFTTNVKENGPQKKMVDFYGSDLQVTVYMLAHHGAENLANKPVMRNAVKPKAVFASSNPWYPKDTWRHPRCNITDYFIHQLQCLCKPAERNPKSRFYCGQHPIKSIPLNDTLQQEFACGMDSLDPPRRNEFAIYSTTPSKDKINVVHLLTDGTKWGFINNIQPKLTR